MLVFPVDVSFACLKQFDGALVPFPGRTREWSSVPHFRPDVSFASINQRLSRFKRKSVELCLEHQAASTIELSISVKSRRAVFPAFPAFHSHIKYYRAALMSVKQRYIALTTSLRLSASLTTRASRALTSVDGVKQ
jgi:hypothetical protein